MILDVWERLLNLITLTNLNQPLEELLHQEYFTNSYMMLETDYSGFGINTLLPDALTPKVARASAGMV